MDIVFQSVRVLKTLAAHGIIKEAQYGNSTRQQLIHLLGGAKYEYEQRQLADHSAKRALEIAKKEAATTLKIPLPKPVKVAPSQGMILEKMQKEAEEKAKLELVLSEDEKDSEDLNTRKSKINSILESIAACSMEQFNNYGLLLALQKLVIQKSIF